MKTFYEFITEQKSIAKGDDYAEYRNEILKKYGDDETKLSKEDRIKFNKEVDDGWKSREESK